MSSYTGWRKSSYSMSNGHCLEVAAGSTWVRSSLSFSNGNCAEVAACGCPEPCILVRDSKDPDGPVLAFDGSTWGAWVAEVKAGRR